MTIFLTLDWQPNEQFLFIFTFKDDFKSSNLRSNLTKVKALVTGSVSEYTVTDINTCEQIASSHYTWAPSHIELGLMTELLSLANRINGSKKRFVLQKQITLMKNIRPDYKILKKIHESRKSKSTTFFFQDKTEYLQMTKGQMKIGWEVTQHLIDTLKTFC